MLAICYVFHLQHHSKNKKCFVCNKPTLGIFNAAQEIRTKMAQDKKQQEG
jgi:RING finger protein 113A